MDIGEINALLLEHGSISKVEKILGYGKDTLRKKLGRLGYSLNKATKQYEPVAPKEEITQVVSPSYKKPKEVIAQVVTPSYPDLFTDNQLKVLHRMIKEYELKERVSVEHEAKGKLGNRNVRVYTDHFNKFSDLCKRLGVTQADMLFEAIEMLVDKYK